MAGWIIGYCSLCQPSPFSLLELRLETDSALSFWQQSPVPEAVLCLSHRGSSYHIRGVSFSRSELLYYPNWEQRRNKYLYSISFWSIQHCLLIIYTSCVYYNNWNIWKYLYHLKNICSWVYSAVSCLVGFYFYLPLSSLFDLRCIDFIQVAPGLQCLWFFFFFLIFAHILFHRALRLNIALISFRYDKCILKHLSWAFFPYFL